MYRNDTGEVGVCAVKPVVVGDKCITYGENVLLKNNQKITLCNEDKSILAEYELRLAA